MEEHQSEKHPWGKSCTGIDSSVGIPYLMATKQAGLSQGVLSQILEMQETTLVFLQATPYKTAKIPVGKKALSCFSYRKEQKYAETLVKTHARLLVKPTQKRKTHTVKFYRNTQHSRLLAAVALISFLFPQGQTGNSHSTGNLTSLFFTKPFWSTLPPLKGYKKSTPAENLSPHIVSSEGDIAKQAPAAAARRIPAACFHPMLFLGISQPQAGWSFLGRSSLLPAALLPEILWLFLHRTANKQEHAAFPQLQKGKVQEQAVATWMVEATHTLLPRAARSRYSEYGLPRRYPTHDAASLDWRQQHLLSTT